MSEELNKISLAAAERALTTHAEALGGIEGDASIQGLASPGVPPGILRGKRG